MAELDAGAGACGHAKQPAALLAPPPRSPRCRTGLAAGLTVLLLALFAAGGGAATYLSAARATFRHLPRQKLMPMGRRPVWTPTLAAPGAQRPLCIVLLGMDARGAEPRRSDVIMVAQLTGERSQVHLVSFPRDLWVEGPGHVRGRIDAAYSHGDAPRVVQTLEHLLDVRMDHTASDGGQWIRRPDPVAMAALAAAPRHGTMPAYAASHPTDVPALAQQPVPTTPKR